jgi:ubiquinone/menaquinone biosynthesis C-methylase UbiE
MNDSAASSKHAQKAADRFDQWADSYGEDRISRWFQHYQHSALDKFGFHGSERFLDVGCGTGWAVRQAAKNLPDGEAFGIDISPLMVRKASSLSHTVTNTRFSQANAESIPYDANYFDSILCTFSFHHYRDPLAALGEIRRVLNKNGTLVIVDSARNVSLAIWMQDRWRRYLERSHVRYYTVDEMKGLLEKSSFDIKSDVITENGFLKFGKIFTGLMIIVCHPI